MVLSVCGRVSLPLRAEGIEVLEIPRGRGETRSVRAALSDIRAQVLLTDRPHDLRTGAKAVLGSGVVLVHRYNLSAPSPPGDLVTRLAYRAVVRKTIFLSEGQRRAVLGAAPFFGRAGSVVIPEGIDTEVFRPRPADASCFRERHSLGNQEFLLAVGALTPEKRYDYLFHALSLVGHDVPLMVVCGAGSEESRLRELASSLALRVSFIGAIPRNDLPGAYSASTLFIHGCAVETFGLSVLEAMSCARPVIAARGGAVPEVVGDAGILVDPQSPDAMGQAISALLADRAHGRQLGVMARARAVAKFSLDAMVDAYHQALIGYIR